MVTIISIISILAYIISLFKLKKKWLEQQIIFLIIYLIGLAIVGELDVLLPIYFVVSLFPFIKHIRKISFFTGMIILYFGLYLMYGLIVQNTIGTLVTFIAKIWQFIVFFIVYDSDIVFEKENYKKIIKMSVITETLLGFYLMMTSTIVDANGLVRLVSNAQPITGNISTVILPISVYYYLKNRENSRRTKWFMSVSLIMLVWIVLSGTRGYTIEFAASMALIFYDYFTNGKVGRISQKNRILTIVLFVIMIFASTVAVPEIFEKVQDILRLKSSVGIRTFENAAVIEFMKNASFFAAVFGIGLGGQGGSYPEMQEALYRQFNLGMWNRNHYLSDSGALFHNLYANVFMCLGISGLFILIIINIALWKRITYSCKSSAWIRRIMHLFQLSFLFVNYYRWSAVCGISEMIIFALVLKLLKNDTMEQNLE